jgi:ATPase subunit of ABC transporter with duplicated ATPase domains
LHSITLRDVTKSHGARLLLDRVSLVVGAGSRIGVVGPNGVGKTTFLRLLAGLEAPDSGSILHSPPGLAVGYLPQELDARAGEAPLAYLERRTGVAAAAEEMDRLAARLGDDPGLAARYHDALERFLALGGGDLAARAAAACAELGLAARLDRPLDALSGGEAARVRLAALLVARFDVFCLDEPTNDLDFAGLERLERFATELRGSLVVVSHDRAFLDRTVTRIVEIEEGSGRLREWPGGWSEYEAARERAREAQYRRFAETEERRRELEALVRDRRAQARTGASLGKRTGGADGRGTHALQTKVRQATRALERLERVDKPFEPWQLQLELAPKSRSGDVIVRLEGAVVERGAFRLGPLDLVLGYGDRLVVTGPNGSGKSTLLGVLLGEVPLAAGRRTRGRVVVVGDLDQGRTRFDDETPLAEAFASAAGMPAGPVRTLLAKFGLGAEDVLRPGATLSPGERTRAALALAAARGVNCLVLDEPTNHLDLPAIEELESSLESFAGTVVLVTHDRRLLERFRPTRELALTLERCRGGR